MRIVCGNNIGDCKPGISVREDDNNTVCIGAVNEGLATFIGELILDEVRSLAKNLLSVADEVEKKKESEPEQKNPITKTIRMKTPEGLGVVIHVLD